MIARQQWTSIIKKMREVVMSDAGILEKSIESCKSDADRYDLCGNDLAAFQCRQLLEWLEELRQKRELIANVRNTLNGVDMISKRDLLKIIGV